jgi:hypothetical protein
LDVPKFGGGLVVSHPEHASTKQQNIKAKPILHKMAVE